jgi:hypothetical protein
MRMRVVFLAILLLTVGFALALSDVRCPTNCSSYCAVAVGSSAPLFCWDRADGYASANEAVAKVVRSCFTGEVFGTATVAYDDVACSELNPPSDDTEILPSTGTSDECGSDGWRPADCP